jgi:multiple sugar transport system permease protein
MATVSSKTTSYTNTKGLTLQEIRRRERIRRNIISYVVLSLVSVFFILPFIYTISTSMKYPGDIFDGRFIPNPVIEPFWYNFFGRTEMAISGLRYDGAFYAGWSRTGIPPFARYYLNSIIVAITVTFLQLVTCSLAAYAFSRLKWPGRNKIFLAYLGTMMVPGQVLMIPWFIMFTQIGLIDTLMAIILPGAFSAYGTFMLRQYFMSIPAALEEAAVIDGASKMQILGLIIVPLSKTALATLAIFTFLFSWNDFMWPLIVLHSDTNKTLPIGLQAFQTSYGAQWHLIMAASLIVLLPVIIVFIAGQKQITKGIMMTGIK